MATTEEAYKKQLLRLYPHRKKQIEAYFSVSKAHRPKSFEEFAHVKPSETERRIKHFRKQGILVGKPTPPRRSSSRQPYKPQTPSQRYAYLLAKAQSKGSLSQKELAELLKFQQQKLKPSTGLVYQEQKGKYTYYYYLSPDKKIVVTKLERGLNPQAYKHTLPLPLGIEKVNYSKVPVGVEKSKITVYGKLVGYYPSLPEARKRVSLEIRQPRGSEPIYNQIKGSIGLISLQHKVRDIKTGKERVVKPETSTLLRSWLIEAKPISLTLYKDKEREVGIKIFPHTRIEDVRYRPKFTKTEKILSVIASKEGPSIIKYEFEKRVLGKKVDEELYQSYLKGVTELKKAKYKPKEYYISYLTKSPMGYVFQTGVTGGLLGVGRGLAGLAGRTAVKGYDIAIGVTGTALLGKNIYEAKRKGTLGELAIKYAIGFPAFSYGYTLGYKGTSKLLGLKPSITTIQQVKTTQKGKPKLDIIVSKLGEDRYYVWGRKKTILGWKKFGYELVRTSRGWEQREPTGIPQALQQTEKAISLLGKGKGKIKEEIKLIDLTQGRTRIIRTQKGFLRTKRSVIDIIEGRRTTTIIKDHKVTEIERYPERLHFLRKKIEILGEKRAPRTLYKELLRIEKPEPEGTYYQIYYGKLTKRGSRFYKELAKMEWLEPSYYGGSGGKGGRPPSDFLGPSTKGPTKTYTSKEVSGKGLNTILKTKEISKELTSTSIITRQEPKTTTTKAKGTLQMLLMRPQAKSKTQAQQKGKVSLKESVSTFMSIGKYKKRVGNLLVYYKEKPQIKGEEIKGLYKTKRELERSLYMPSIIRYSTGETTKAKRRIKPVILLKPKPKVEIKPSVKNIIEPSIKPIFEELNLTDLTQNLRMREEQKLRRLPLISLLPKTTTLEGQKLRPYQVELPKLTETPSLTNLLTTTLKPSRKKTPKPPIKPPRRGRKKKVRGEITTKPRAKYQPSLIATLKRIRRKKRKRILTGWEIRPILTTSKKKRAWSI